MDLQQIRGPVVFTASSLVVYLFCCIPFIALLVGCLGKIVLSLVVGTVVSMALKSEIDQLFRKDQGPRVNSTRKAVFITGCDTGFGHDLALRLHALGFHVYAGCLFPGEAGAKKLREHGADGRLRVVLCDVTKTEQVQECAAHIQKELQEMKVELLAVVNNAGVSVVSEFEWIPIESYEKIIDVNTLGPVRVVKAFLPMLRKTCGRIVMVSSLSGRYAIPGMTGYSMSKHAMVALADGLRRELKKFKIQVSLIEPGSYKTQLAARDLIQKEAEKHWSALSWEVQSAYGPSYRDKFVSHLGDLTDIKASALLSEPVDAIIDAVTSLTPQIRYVPGDLAVRIRGMLLPLLPPWLQDILLSSLSIGLPESLGR